MILRVFLIDCLVLILLFCGISSGADDNNVNLSIVGGQCTYKQYDGHVRIIAVNQRDYHSYDVKFLFHPDQEILETFAKFEGREILLFTKRGSYPRTPFVQGNGIEVGKNFFIS